MRWIGPSLLLAMLAAGVLWATSFATIERADFTFCNGTEIKSIDPAVVKGVPEARVIYGIFEGLVNFHPETLEPTPGVAERWEISDDGLVYTFHINPQARWSDGSPVTAEDFRWSWRRMLHPETAAPYSYQAYSIHGAQEFNTLRFEPGDRVEVELADRPNEGQMFPSGTLLHGRLERVELFESTQDGVIRLPDETESEASESEASEASESDAKKSDADEDDENEPLRVYVVAMDDGRTRRWSTETAANVLNQLQAENCQWVVLDFDQHVGIEVLDEHTLRVTLNDPTPYFLKLVAFYTLFPVHQPSITEFGAPDWTKPDRLVCNGAFTVGERRIRDRMRLNKNPHYWNADQVALNTVDVLALQGAPTMLNLYLTGQVDWITDVPSAVIPDLRDREDFHIQPQLGTYFYRLNTTVKPLDDVRVRRALALAIDKEAITKWVTLGGEVATNRVVPPGIDGYETAINNEFNPQEAQRLLAEAGFPNGQGFPRLEILYNTHEAHQAIAEVVQAQWARHLGIRVGLTNMEWQSYLEHTQNMKYSIGRAGWIGDYVDPNTFLDMWVSGGANNETGWSHPEYDRLIAEAAKTQDPDQRMELFHQAEAILVEEKPIIPIYHYVTKNMVRPEVQGFYGNPLDVHPLSAIRMAE